jgi:hypothetical protein
MDGKEFGEIGLAKFIKEKSNIHGDQFCLELFNTINSYRGKIQ